MKNVIKNFWATSYIEYKAIENNKQIIYTQLMVPILYFVFFGFGIGNSFSSLAFKGENVSYYRIYFRWNNWSNTKFSDESICL